MIAKNLQKMKFSFATLTLLACSLWLTSPAQAQKKADALPTELTPPRILSSELAERTEVLRGELLVDFVVVDDDKITELKINGKEQEIVPGRIVSVTKLFNFKRRKTTVKVIATDEKGNVSKKIFIIRTIKTETLQKGRGSQRFFSLGFDQEKDSNPTTVDDQTASTEANRTVTSIVFGQNFSLGQMFFSGQSTSYAKEEFNTYNVDAYVIGLSSTFRKTSPQLRFTFSLGDVDVGEKDYYVSNSYTLAGGVGRYLLGGQGAGADINLNQKKFADTSKVAVSAQRAKLGVRFANKELRASIAPSFVVGSDSEGTDDSKYDYNTLLVDARGAIGKLSLNVNFQQQVRKYTKNIRKDDRQETKIRLRFKITDRISLLASQTSSSNDSKNVPNSESTETSSNVIKRKITSFGLQGTF